MKQFVKTLALLLFLGTAFYSCQKDDLTQEVQPQAEDYLIPIPNKIVNGDFDILPTPDSHSLKNVSALL